MFIRHGDSNIFLRSCISLLQRDVKFVNKIVLALSNKEIIKINVIDLEKLYNFVVKNVLIWIRLGLQNSIWNFLCRVFYFWHSANKVFAECQKKNAWQRIFKFKKFNCSFCITRWFQNKKLSTTKFHHFLRSTKFI